MVRPEIIHLELGPQLWSHPHPDPMLLPRGFTIRGDDIKRLAVVIVMVRIRSLEAFNNDISFVGDQRRDKYLCLLREQRRRSIERGVRNLTRSSRRLGILVAPLERELPRIHFVLKLERYSGGFGGERSNDGIKNSSAVIQSRGGLDEIQERGGEAATLGKPGKILAVPVITMGVVVIGVVVP